MDISKQSFLMPRKPRIHFPGAAYQVILRGNALQSVFVNQRNHCRFYLFLQESVERFRCRIDGSTYREVIGRVVRSFSFFTTPCSILPYIALQKWSSEVPFLYCHQLKSKLI